MTRAVAIIDGEHYAPVVRDALAALPYDVVAALLVGGTEKLRGGEDYGVPLVDARMPSPRTSSSTCRTSRCSGRARALSLDQPRARARLSYVGADFRFDPPRFPRVRPPVGRRDRHGEARREDRGDGASARLLARDRDGRRRGDGPRRSRRARARAHAAERRRLLALSRDGRHAASDHLELAALTGVVTIGCRRAGGGLAGQVLDSNVAAGAALARSLEPDVVVFRRQRRVDPAVATTARVLVTSPEHDLDAYLNPYRVAISDLVVGIGDVAGADLRAELRLRPAAPLRGTARRRVHDRPAPVEHLDAEVVHVSRALANRDALRAELASVDADVYLVELKAAAIDVVARPRRSEAPSSSWPRTRSWPTDWTTRCSRSFLRRFRCDREAAPAVADPRRGRASLFQGRDGARADGRRTRGGAGVRARAADREDLDTSGLTLELDRVQELAVELFGEEEGGAAPRAQAAQGARAAGDRRARDPADRRLDRHRQVDGRHRGGLSPRHHASDLDGLHPADDARVFCTSSCRRSTTRASTPARRCARPRTRTTDARGFLEQTRNVLVGVRASIDRACRRVGRWCSKACTSSRGWCRDARERARRAVRPRDRRRDRACRPLLGA